MKGGYKPSLVMLMGVTILGNAGKKKVLPSSGVIIRGDLRYVMKLPLNQCIDMHSAFFVCRKY